MQQRQHVTCEAISRRKLIFFFLLFNLSIVLRRKGFSLDTRCHITSLSTHCHTGNNGFCRNPPVTMRTFTRTQTQTRTDTREGETSVGQ